MSNLQSVYLAPSVTNTVINDNYNHIREAPFAFLANHPRDEFVAQILI